MKPLSVIGATPPVLGMRANVLRVLVYILVPTVFDLSEVKHSGHFCSVGYALVGRISNILYALSVEYAFS